MRYTSNYIEKFFSSSSNANNLFLFEKKRVKSLFALMYILNEVSKGKRILYISEFDVIDDLEKIHKDFKVAKKLIEKIRSKKYAENIIISSDLSSLNKVLGSNFKDHFDRIIYDEVSMGIKLPLDKIKKIFINRNLKLDILRFERPLEACTELCPHNCVHYTEMTYLDGCARISYDENKPKYFFQKKKREFTFINVGKMGKSRKETSDTLNLD